MIVLRFIVVRLEHGLPNLLLIIRARIREDRAIIYLLVLIIMFNAMRDINAVTLNDGARLNSSIRALIMERQRVTMTLSLLRITILHTTVQTLMTSTCKVDLDPLTHFGDHLRASLYSRASGTSTFCVYECSVVLYLFNRSVSNAVGN